MSDRDDAQQGVSRRSLLFGGGGIIVGGVAVAAGAAALGARPATDSSESTPATTGPVPSRGPHQAGIDRPTTPQRNGLLVTADLPGSPTTAAIAATVAAMGEAIDALTDPEHSDPRILPDGPGDLTVTIGLGPRLVRTIDPTLPGADDLPSFAGDDGILAGSVGGDLLVAVSSSNAADLHAVATAVIEAAHATRRWSQAGVRGAGEGTIVRNPLGFHDGIIVPHTDAEMAENVWIADGPAAGGTILVVRRLRLAVDRFRTLPDADQERVIGRERDGVPLSGGSATAEVNLGAKTPEGEYLIPARSHARAAHPSFTGSALMLRRGYAFSNAVTAGESADDGLLFICFQRDLDTFVRTQQRLDETDDLMAFATPTASATFLVLPGRTGAAPLGASLFAPAP